MAATWHVGKVVSAGVIAPDYETTDIEFPIKLKLNALEESRWYLAERTQGRIMLSVALTAITTGNEVEVKLEDTKEYSRIYRIYVHNK